MPEYVTSENSINDKKCSKCKRTKEAGFFITNGMLYKTCNVCRAHSRRNSRAAIDERMAAAADNEADDDDDDVVEEEDTYASTTMRASIREGRRLAAIQRRADAERRWNRFNMTGDAMSRLSDTIISHHQAYEFNAFADFDERMQQARFLSSSAAAASSNDAGDYFVDEPDPEPEPGDSD
jgi:hypothetical protein